MLRVFCFAVALFVVSACSSTDRQMWMQAAQSKNARATVDNFVKQKQQQYQADPNAILRDVQQLQAVFKQLQGKAGNVWGAQNTDLPTNKKYVKYTDNYQSRAIVDFNAGKITVETIGGTDPKARLKKAITTTLLTTDDPAATDIFSAKAPDFNGKPYLYGQVLDQDAKAIQFEWRAARFADYVIDRYLTSRIDPKGTHYSVAFPMVTNHHSLRKKKYSEHVLASSAKYKIPASLIYAIIETESSFNPFAVSSANAYGLMQVVPATAGKDVYIRVKKRSGQPSKSTLFDPRQNIDIGTAYLHLLEAVYLNKVTNHQSLEYAIISAYNGGAGNVLKTFSADRKHAPTVINGMSPSQVYWRLTQKHPRSESRRYLEKVTGFKKKYL